MHQKTIGLILAIGAFCLWGCYPLLWALLKGQGARPLEILAHRIVWAHAFGLLSVVFLKTYHAEQNLLPKRPRTWAACTVSGGLNVINWLICIWGATSGHLIEISFGYFLAPLLAAALGVVIYREHLVGLQWVALLLATSAIGIACIMSGQVPWVALTAAATAATYAAVRKFVEPQAIAGMLIETALFMPIGIVYLSWLQSQHVGIFGRSLGVSAACLLAGLVTAIAILFYAGAATRLRLSTLGILQYIYPCAQLLLGIFFFREQLTASSAVMLSGILLALVVYSWASVQMFLTTLRQRQRALIRRPLHKRPTQHSIGAKSPS